MPQGLRAPLLLALLVAGAAAMPPPEHCEAEMNKIKDLLQVSCEGQGLSSIPSGLPKDTGILLLGSNHLAQVAMASFQPLQQLSELDLSNNSLEALETSTPLSTLQQLLLSHNSLESLPVFRGLPGLKRLALGHNNISQLPEGGFRDLGQLQDLELQGNRLQSLPAGAFKGLGELMDLDLSENLLEALPPDLLAELPKLEILRLERNRLRRVPDGFFSKEVTYEYVYLAENPWLCDCQLLYLRDWIIKNEISIYTRTSVQEHGSEKVVTENEPESVQCHEPDKEKGQPVMRFQAACRKHGDIDETEDGDDPTDDSWTLVATPSTWKPTTAVPLTTLFSVPSSLPSHSPSTAPPSIGAPQTTTTSTCNSSTAVNSTTTYCPTATSDVPSTVMNVLTTTPAISTVNLSTTGVTVGRSAATSSDPTVTPGSSASHVPTTPSPAFSVPTTPATTSSTPFAHRTTALMSTAPVAQSVPSPATGMARPPPSTVDLVPSSTEVKSSPRIPSPVSPLPSLQPSAHCLCPALPVRVLGVAPHKGSPAHWPAGHCCLLRLSPYLACLVLVAPPTLVVLCLLAWVCLSWYHPALPGTPRACLARHQQWQKVTPEAWQLEMPSVPGAAPGPRIYRVCKKFRVAPPRHITWLLVSLPGSARVWPWEQRQGSLSCYSLDRGRDTIGTVGIKYAASSL